MTKRCQREQRKPSNRKRVKKGNKKKRRKTKRRKGINQGEIKEGERLFFFPAKINVSSHSGLGVLSREQLSKDVGRSPVLCFRQTFLTLTSNTKLFCFKKWALQTASTGVFIVQHMANYLIYISIVTISRIQAKKTCAVFVQQLHCHIPVIVQLYAAV